MLNVNQFVGRHIGGYQIERLLGQSQLGAAYLAQQPGQGLFLLGNAEYISPERVLGLPMSARADIYSLGVMLFALLSGTHPFRGTQPLDVALQRMQKPVPSLHTICADVSEAFDLVIGRAMERDPAKRPARASDVARLFERALTSQNPAWGISGAAAGQVLSDAQTTLPPTVNWFDEQAMPSGRWEAVPSVVHEQFPTTILSGNSPESASPPAGASFLNSAAPDSLGGTDPFAWWATTSTSQPKSAPLPGTFPWSAPVRKANANLSRRSRPGQLDRRKLIMVLVTGAAAAGVAVTGISFARLLQSTQSSSTQLASGSSGGQTASTGGSAPTADATQGTQQAQGTGTPSASATARSSATPGAKGSPTAQPTPRSQPTPKPGHTGTVIGYTTQANNSAVSFTNPANGNASLLIRMANGTFIACEKACTHAGVPCNYDSGSQKVVCPAHGATFNPASGFAPTSPAPSPLPRVSIRVNADGTVTTG